jgi:transcriptional regulator with XRE-family HTH domain
MAYQARLTCIISGVTTNDPTPADTMNTAVAAVLRAEKAAQKLTYPTLVEATGIPAVSLKRYFAGDRDITVRVLSLIAQALNMTPGEIWAKAAERM